MNLIQENVLSFSCIQYVTRIVEEWKKIIQFDLYSSRKFSLFRRDRHLYNNSNMRNDTNIGTFEVLTNKIQLSKFKNEIGFIQ